jgi:hypothetical protein
MTKGKKPEVSSFEKALDFLALTYKAGEDQSTYAFMEMGSAVTFNLTVGLGSPIDVDLAACPHIDLLRTAIQRCGQTFAITQLAVNKLLVRANDFHAYIPCVVPGNLVWPSPDAMIAPLNDDFLEALNKVAPMADTKAETVLECAIQLYDGSVLATNRSVVIEAWHGNPTPEGLLLPKVAAVLLRRAKKHLQGFGFSPTTMTFHFTDGCWLRSQLYQDRLPNIKRHIEGASQDHLHDIPYDFFPAVDKVAPFSASGNVWVEQNLVSSHPFDAKEEGSGLALEFSGEGHAYRVYGASDLHLIRKIATKWDEHARDDGTLFFGEKVRGMIWHGKKREGTAPSADDNDIPF